MHIKGKAKHSDHPILDALDALQKLHQLLLPGGAEIVDTPMEVEFLLQHCHDPIDTLIEQDTLLALTKNITDNIEKLASNPKLQATVKDIIHTLEEAYSQNSPRLG